MATAPKTLCSVQALRGLAALMVVLSHANFLIQEKELGPQVTFPAGPAGVDIFFAISGLVMVITTTKLRGKEGAWATFLLRRLIRIAPLYWIFTLLKMGIAFAVPGALFHSEFGWWHTIASFLFIPAVKPGTQLIQPVLTVGWTLCFEMFFYLLFAISLGFKRQVSIVTGLLFIALGFSAFYSPSWWAITNLFSPLLWEFLFGVWIGVIVIERRLLPSPVAMILAPAAFLFLVVALQIWPVIVNPSAPIGWQRILGWGIPGALLLFCAISLEERLKLPRWILLIGDASYSIYLSHVFVLTLVAACWGKLHHTGLVWSYSFAVICLLIATSAGILAHWFIEMPLIHSLNQAVRQPDPVGVKATTPV